MEFLPFLRSDSCCTFSFAVAFVVRDPALCTSLEFPLFTPSCIPSTYCLLLLMPSAANHHGLHFLLSLTLPLPFPSPLCLSPAPPVPHDSSCNIRSAPFAPSLSFSLSPPPHSITSVLTRGVRGQHTHKKKSRRNGGVYGAQSLLSLQPRSPHDFGELGALPRDTRR